MVERFPIIPLLIATSLILLTLAIFAWRKRFIGNSAIFLSLSMLGVAFYNFGYSMELASGSFLWVMWWVRFQHLGIFLIVPTWLLFAISVSGYKKQINYKFILAVSIIPIVLFLMAQTLGWLNLAHHNPRLDTLGSYQVLAYDRNLFNHISVGYYSLCLGVSTVLFAMMFFRSAPSARRHVLIYLIGSLPPFATMIIYNLNLVPSGLDFTPLLLGVSAFIFAFGLLKFRILDLIPLARNAIFEDMTTGVLISDMEGQIIDFNPAFQAIFKQSVTKPRSKVVEFFADYPKLKKWLEEESTERISFQLSADEKKTYYRVSWSEITDRKQRVIGKLISFDENTQEKLLLDKLEIMASHDGLTGIYNRQHFDQLGINEISRVQRYGGDLSLCLIDLDNFKRVNDTYGHIAGDQVLVAVAQTLQGQLRASDILARFGGEEFVILLPETDLESAKHLCERLQRTLAEQIVHYDEKQITIRASFGVTKVQSIPALTLESVYKLADQALYRAKESGGNRVDTAPTAEN